MCIDRERDRDVVYCGVNIYESLGEVCLLIKKECRRRDSFQEINIATAVLGAVALNTIVNKLRAAPRDGDPMARDFITVFNFVTDEKGRQSLADTIPSNRIYVPAHCCLYTPSGSYENKIMEAVDRETHPDPTVRFANAVMLTQEYPYDIFPTVRRQSPNSPFVGELPDGAVLLDEWVQNNNGLSTP